MKTGAKMWKEQRDGLRRELGRAPANYVRRRLFRPRLPGLRAIRETRCIGEDIRDGAMRA